METRLEAGWGQRIAWSVLVWGTLGLLSVVPFLYVAVRRKQPSDWGALSAFVLYELIMIPWSIATSSGPGDPFLGVVTVLVLLTGTAMLLFAVFDRKTPQTPPPPYGMAPAAQPGPPYGHPYGG